MEPDKIKSYSDRIDMQLAIGFGKVPTVTIRSFLKGLMEAKDVSSTAITNAQKYNKKIDDHSEVLSLRYPTKVQLQKFKLDHPEDFDHVISLMNKLIKAYEDELIKRA